MNYEMQEAVPSTIEVAIQILNSLWLKSNRECEIRMRIEWMGEHLYLH